MLIGAGSVIKPGLTVSKPLPPVAYYVDSAIGIVNEGDTMTFNVSTIAVADGTVLYWKIENETTTDGRFAATNGSVIVIGGIGAFGVSPVADHLTEGTTSFHITLRTGSVNGTVVWTTGSKAVGDTSVGPVSLLFDGSSNHYLQAGYAATYPASQYEELHNTTYIKVNKGSYPTPQPGWQLTIGYNTFSILDVADGGAYWTVHWSGGNSSGGANGSPVTFTTVQPFALGSTCTFEFWVKLAASSLGNGQYLGAIMTQHDGGGSGIDIFQQGGNICISDGSNIGYFTEPAAGIWTHIAAVFPGSGYPLIFYNGQQQTQVGGVMSGFGQFNNTSDGLTIGKRGPTVPYQFFNGKIANIRINNTAVYSGSFAPQINLTNITGTVLLWTPDANNQTVDSSSVGIPITNNGAVVDNSYPSAYVYSTAHYVYSNWTNNMYGADTVFIHNDLPSIHPQVGWTVTDGTNARVIINTGFGVTLTSSGVGPMYILQLNSAVDFNSAATLTLID